LWQTQFQKNLHVIEFLKRLDPFLNAKVCMDTPKKWIRDVALGGDHTLILSHNKKDVIAFGKGGEGQLGLSSKPWVSCPAKSKVLSSSNADVAAVCAYRHCSFTLDEGGAVKNAAGKCSFEIKGLQKALSLCRQRAHADGLISIESCTDATNEKG
jgi:alpha-tubulin suppressor-like RCC1 family protein